MGTFTATYFLKTALWDKKGLWASTLVVAYIARCLENSGYQRAEMMKGHSRLFADRLKQIPSSADPWKY